MNERFFAHEAIGDLYLDTRLGDPGAELRKVLCVWAPVHFECVIVGERTIDVHIRRIREKLGIDNIKTIKGVGYKYAAV